MDAATRHGNRLVITIRPEPSDDGLLRVSEAFQQVLDTLKLFEQAEHSLGTPHATFVWRLEKAVTGSPLTVVALAEAADPAIDVTPQVIRVKSEVANGIRNLITRGERPRWMGQDGVAIVGGLLARNLNGIAETDIDFDVPAIDRLAIDRNQASVGLRAVEAINPLDVTGIPERIAYGEIEGQMVAAGRYRRQPAIQILTHLYGSVWCVLSRSMIGQFGDEQKLADVWRDKIIAVFGRLHYLAGGRLSRIDAENVRIVEAPPFDLDSLLDPDFTAGFDPVEYLERLHEGNVG